MHGRQAAPVDERAQDPAVAQIGQDGRYPGSVEGKKLGVRHFAGGHGELAVIASGHVTRDPYVIGLVGEDETGGRIAFQQASKNRRIGRITANDAMRAELENIADFSDRSRGVGLERSLLQPLRGVTENDMVHFGPREPGDLDRRVHQDQLFKLYLQRVEIPLSFFGEAVSRSTQAVADEVS